MTCKVKIIIRYEHFQLSIEIIQYYSYLLYIMLYGRYTIIILFLNMIKSKYIEIPNVLINLSYFQSNFLWIYLQ